MTVGPEPSWRRLARAKPAPTSSSISYELGLSRLERESERASILTSKNLKGNRLSESSWRQKRELWRGRLQSKQARHLHACVAVARKKLLIVL